MGKKRPSSSDNVFKFEIPSSPKTSTEAQHSSTDSPSSVFFRSKEDLGAVKENHVRALICFLSVGEQSCEDRQRGRRTSAQLSSHLSMEHPTILCRPGSDQSHPLQRVQVGGSGARPPGCSGLRLQRAGSGEPRVGSRVLGCARDAIPMTELQQEVEDAKPAKVLGKREGKVGLAQ
ncbi:hypothetical protein ACRRTK_020764 [Alexandromys fortis]